MHRKTQWYLFCLLSVITMILLITGCNSADTAWKVYEGSAVDKSFPVPKEASKAEAALKSSKMEYVRYAVPGLREDSKLPTAYEEEIKAWGWTENKAEQTGSTRVFMKNNQIIQLSLQKNAFILYIPKTNDVAVQGLNNQANNP
ncbi:hypothetical protein AWM70_19015 [Paenibacillus yonginensis]|uniref:Lipoprotein n=1 Tax=Paenibacillus yonginensis TaxID=1462996 RepID=A0A1B1N4R7_9BACL|nr:hypothetical protein [Paenibacillus yonginensis]ANS76407.1 hypothetical protein AWM70_19015 [Paenibacillus yonginensis]